MKESLLSTIPLEITQKLEMSDFIEKKKLTLF